VNRHQSLLTFLLALAVFPYFIDLGGSAIWDANEAFYVETPREMMERGDYIRPTFNYEPRENKPVLSYWIVAAFYHVFGISVGVQRVPIALGGLVLIATAFGLAWAASPQRTHAGDQALSTRRFEAALWAALGLAMTPRLLMFARRIFIDIYISMFLGLTLLCFALAERSPGRRRPFLLLMYLAVGLGVLTKGPIAIVLPGMVFALYLVLHGEIRRVSAMMLPAGVLIVAAVVVPWYAALYMRGGWEPINTFIFGENVARYTDGVGVDSDRGPLFYLPVLFSDSFPWSMFLFVAAAMWWSGRRVPPEGDERAQRLQTLLWIWNAVVVLFFSASAAKQDLYIFPIVPAVAALAGIAIAAGLRDPTPGVRGTAAFIGVVVAVAGAGVLYLARAFAGSYVLAGARVMGVAAVAGGIAALALAALRRPRSALTFIAMTFVLLDWVFVLRVLPAFERYKPVPGFAGTLASRLQPGDEVVTYDEALPSLVFYLRRPVDPIFEADELFAKFRSGATVYAVLSAENYLDVKNRIGIPTCEIERRPTFDVKLRNMLERDAPPELVLITNRCTNSELRIPNSELRTTKSQFTSDRSCAGCMSHEQEARRSRGIDGFGAGG
jgi:4-amino-4-deoxy-L-arabinose transferase-like glycosyltransferase